MDAKTTGGQAGGGPVSIWTIGHSTLPTDEFLALLRSRGIGLLFDVRRFPASRRHPQFGGEALQASLACENILYRHMPALGGRREPRPDSVNTGWRESAFRGYADHMETPAFQQALSAVVEEAATWCCVPMCAEKDWHNCHRGLIADSLKAVGRDVVHIVDAARDEPHPWTGVARMVGGKLSYAADAPAQSSLGF